jgi:hypothetical protein
MAPTNDKYRAPPWIMEVLRMGSDVSPEAFEAALRQAGWKPNSNQAAYIKRLENAWRKPYRQRPSSLRAWPNPQNPKRELAVDPRDWRPIETAPEDQIVVLSVPRGEGQPPAIFEGQWHLGNCEWRSADEQWAFFGSPTHWQPCGESRAGRLVVEAARVQNIAPPKKASRPVLKRREPAPLKRPGRPKRVLGTGRPIEQLKRNLTIHTAIAVDGHRRRTGRKRVPKDAVLAFIRKAIPDFAKACGTRMPEDHYTFAIDIYDAAFKTGRYKILKR